MATATATVNERFDEKRRVHTRALARSSQRHAVGGKRGRKRGRTENGNETKRSKRKRKVSGWTGGRAGGRVCESGSTAHKRKKENDRKEKFCDFNEQQSGQRAQTEREGDRECGEHDASGR